jgi:hypothetical protein
LVSYSEELVGGVAALPMMSPTRALVVVQIHVQTRATVEAAEESPRVDGNSYSID